MDLFAEVKFKKMHPEATVPTRATQEASGLDLYALYHFWLGPGEFGAVPTGVAIELPPGYEGQVRPRSGLAAKHGVTVLNSPGTIDSDYRGELKVLLINHGKTAFQINPKDRIGQLVIAQTALLKTVEVEALGDTDRGEKGFGSTGR